LKKKQQENAKAQAARQAAAQKAGPKTKYKQKTSSKGPGHGLPAVTSPPATNTTANADGIVETIVPLHQRSLISRTGRSPVPAPLQEQYSVNNKSKQEAVSTLVETSFVLPPLNLSQLNNSSQPVSHHVQPQQVTQHHYNSQPHLPPPQQYQYENQQLKQPHPSTHEPVHQQPPPPPPQLSAQEQWKYDLQQQIEEKKRIKALQKVQTELNIYSSVYNALYYFPYSLSLYFVEGKK
jgi:hypothetical protein